MQWQENIDVDCSQKKICIELAQICIDSNPHNRPTIDEIIQKLNETETMILKDPTVIREPRNDPESSLYQVLLFKPSCNHVNFDLKKMWSDLARSRTNI